MEFVNLLEIIGNEPVFETGLLLAGDVDPAGIRRQLSRWKEAGKVYQLRRGLYALPPPYQKVRPHPFLVANRLMPASYVSLQSALAYYGMIPEYVPVTTSVTSGRPGNWETPLGTYDFRHIQVGFLNGYQYVDVDEEQSAFIASPEKALLDLLYLQPGGDSIDYLRELRLENLERLDWEEFDHLAGLMGKPKLVRGVVQVRALADEEEQYEIL